mmetsp:Transcript_23297/g.35435  ORF Transcript_23297/g.35435 Transcript_23297/m.35435 type:complete len:101 (-) Transcript_23297:113-415(-)
MRHIRQLDDDSWFCPPTADVLNRAELENIDEYIHRRRDTVKNCVRSRPLYQACIQSRALSTYVHKVVWWQLMRDLKTAKTCATLKPDSDSQNGMRQRHTH